MEHLMNRKEVAAVLGVTVRKVQQLASSGRLAETKLGHRTVRYSRDAVEALARRGEVKTASRKPARKAEAAAQDGKAGAS